MVIKIIIPNKLIIITTNDVFEEEFILFPRLTQNLRLCFTWSFTNTIFRSILIKFVFIKIFITTYQT